MNNLRGFGNEVSTVEPATLLRSSLRSELRTGEASVDIRGAKRSETREHTRRGEEGETVAVTASDESVLRAPKVSIQRYKGLGEMNSEELWETTMDPAKRVLKKIAIEDAQEADKVFDMLMGVDVPARKSFIQSNAKLAQLDI